MINLLWLRSSTGGGGGGGVWSTGDIITATRLNLMEGQYESIMADVGDTYFPIDSIYITVVNTNPSTFLGFGTWSVFGTGRTLVGLNAADPEFDTVLETGGAKTVQLTTAQIPSHTHLQDPHTHLQNSHNHTQLPHNHTLSSIGAAESVGQTDLDATVMHNSGSDATNNTTATNQATTAVNQATTATNQSTGGDGFHNNLQPYIVVFMWRRTG